MYETIIYKKFMVCSRRSKEHELNWINNKYSVVHDWNNLFVINCGKKGKGQGKVLS